MSWPISMGKTYEQIFSEFEGTAKLDQTMGSGDVKYHMGFGSKVTTASGKETYLKVNAESFSSRSG